MGGDARMSPGRPLQPLLPETSTRDEEAVIDPNVPVPQGAPRWAPVPAAPAALTAAYDALAGTSMAGAAEIVVKALDTGGMLQAPGENSELRALVAQATGYSALYTQTCETGQHRHWFAEVIVPVPCPWCMIARLQDVERRHQATQHQQQPAAVQAPTIAPPVAVTPASLTERPGGGL